MKIRIRTASSWESISDPVAQGVGRGKHPLADRDVRNHVVHQMRCRIRHPSPSARRAYPAGLAGERHDAVQLAAAASDPEEASREDTTSRNDRNSFSMKPGTCRSLSCWAA